MIKHFVQSVGAFFTAEHCKKNAAAKNRIDESGGVARKQPAIAVQTRASIREIGFDIGLRNAPRVRHAFRDGWLFRQSLLEKIVSTELGFAKSFTVENNADARSLIRKWNQPEPTIDSTNQNCQRAVNSFRTPHTIVMCEDRQLLKMIIGLLDLELPSDHGGASAGIDKVTRLDWISRAIGSH